MRVTKRDFLAIGALALLVALLLVTGIGREKAKMVPVDDRHLPFYEAMAKGASRIETEKGCTTCHNPQAHPLPEKHPPKEQCLICHKLRRL